MNSFPETEEEAKRRVSKWVESFPEEVNFCLLSKSTVEECCLQSKDLVEPKDESKTNCLVITRIKSGQLPLTALVQPREGVQEGSVDSSRVKEEILVDIGDVLSDFSEIMRDSKQSTANTEKIETREEKVEWWERRLKLDLRLEASLR